MADNWKNNILPEPGSLDLGSLEYNENDSLTDIAGKYTNLGSQINGLTKAAADDVHTRQTKLIGNDFGGVNPMMYATYYQPAANDAQSEMRIKGTEKALEEGMERGKAAAEAEAKAAQDQYSQALDSYKNAKEAYANLRVAMADSSMLPDGTDETEAANFMNMTDRDETRFAGLKNYTDQMNIDWSDSDVWSNTSSRVVSEKAGDTSNWKQEDWDAFWKRNDVSADFTRYYISSKLEKDRGAEAAAQFNTSADNVLRNMDAIFDKINNITEKLPELNWDVYIPDEADLTKQIGNDHTILNELTRDNAANSVAEYRKDSWIEENIPEEYQEQIKQYAREQKEQFEEFRKSKDSRFADQFAEVQNFHEQLARDYVEKIKNIVSGEAAKQEEFNFEMKQETQSLNEVLKNVFGFDTMDMIWLDKWRDQCPDEYESYKHQLSMVMGLSDTLEVADGERWYWTGKEYEQLPAGTPVFFAYSGAIDENGKIVDKELQNFVDLWKDYYSADVEAIDPSELTTKQEALNDAYGKYMQHVSAALMVNANLNVKITKDVYNSILANFSSDISKSNETIEGKKISDWLKEFNKKSQAEKYQIYTDLMKASYSKAGSFLRFSAEQNGILRENLNYADDSQAAGYSKFDVTQTAVGTGQKEASEYANMEPETAAAYMLALTRSMEQFNNNINTAGNVDPAFMDRNLFQHGIIDLGSQLAGTVSFWESVAALGLGALTAPFTGKNAVDADFFGIEGTNAANVIGSIFSGERKYNMDNPLQAAQYLTALDKTNREYAESVINPLLIDVYFGDKELADVRGVGDKYTSEGHLNLDTALETAVTIGNMFLVNWAEGVAIGGAINGTASIASKAANSKVGKVLSFRLLGKVNGKKVKDVYSQVLSQMGTKADNIDDLYQARNVLADPASFADDAAQADIAAREALGLTFHADDAVELGGQLGPIIRNADELKSLTSGNYGVLSPTVANALSSLSSSDLEDMLVTFNGFVKRTTQELKNAGTTNGLDLIDIPLKNGQKISALEATAAFTANKITGDATLALATGLPIEQISALPHKAQRTLLQTLNGMTSASQSTVTNSSLREFLRTMTPDDFKSLTAEFLSRNEINNMLGKRWDTFDTYRAAAAAGWERSGRAALTREFVTDALTDPFRDFKRNVSVPYVDREGNARVQTVQEYFTSPENLAMNLGISSAHFTVARIYNQVAGSISAHAANRAWDAYNATGDKASEAAMKAYQKAIKLNAKAQKYSDKAWKKGLSFQKASKNVELSNKIVDDAVKHIFDSSGWDLDYSGKTKHFDSADDYINFLTNKNMPVKDGLYVLANSTNIKAINNYYMFKTQIGTALNEVGNIPQSARLSLLNTFNETHKANIERIRSGKGDFDSKNHEMYLLMKNAALEANKNGEYGLRIRNLDKSLTSFFNNLENLSKAGRADGTLQQQRIGYIPTSSLYFDGSYDDMVQSHRMAATRGLLHEGGSVDVSAANPAEPRDIFNLDALLKAMNNGDKTFDVKDADGNILRTVQLDYEGTNILDMMTTYSNNYNLHKYIDPLMGNNRTDFGTAALQNNHAYIIGNWNRVQKAWSKDIKRVAGRLKGFDKKVDGKTVHVDGWFEKIAARAVADGKITEAQSKKLFKDGAIEVNVKAKDKADLGKLRTKYATANSQAKAAKAILDQGDAPDSIYPFVSTIFHLDKNGTPDIKGAKEIVDNGRKVANVLVKAYTNGEISEESLRTGYTMKTQSGYRDIMIDEIMLEKLDNAAKHNGQLDSDLIFYAAVMNEPAVPYKLVSNKRGIKVKQEVEGYVNRLQTPEAKPFAPDVTSKNMVKDVKLIEGHSLDIKPKSNTDAKARVKGALANKYIGYGEKGSATARYAKQAGKMANTGEYGPQDIVFVSMQGKRGNDTTRRTLNKKTIDEAVKALDAGATIITDNAEYVMKSSYNVGEKNLYNYLSRKGYHYEDLDVDGTVVGTWRKSVLMPERTLPETFEASTAGHKEFSPLNAKFAEGTEIMGVDISGKTIEDVYQTVLKGSGKGKVPAKDSILGKYTADAEKKAGKKLTKAEKEAISQRFQNRLYDIWGEQNPELKSQIEALPAGTKITDKFAKTGVSQANALQRWVKPATEVTKDTRLYGESYLQDIASRIKSANARIASKTFGTKLNDEGEVQITFGGTTTTNARTGKTTTVGGTTVDATRYYSAERRLGRSESGDMIEKTSESMIKIDEDVATSSLYASTGVKNKNGVPDPTAFQKRYAETVIDLTKTELGDSGDSFDGGDWILAIDKNAGDPELVKAYGVDNDVSYTAVSKDGKVSTKQTNLAQRVKNLEQAGALGAFRDNLEMASIYIMAGKYNSILPNGMKPEDLAAIAVKARNFMDTNANYGYHPKRSETLSTMVDEEGNVLDQTQAYSDIAYSNIRGETEQVYDLQGRSIDLDKANVKDHLDAFKFAVNAFSDESNPLHEIFTNESLDNLVAKRTEFNTKTRSIAEKLNAQAKALYDSGENNEFNRMVDQAYQNILARTQKYGGKAGDNEIKFQYLEALGVAAPGSGLNSIGTGSYGQSTRRFYAAQTAKSTGVEDLGEEGWSAAVTKMRLDAGSQEGYANQLVEGIQRFQTFAGEGKENINLLNEANETLSSIKSLTDAKPFGAEDNFEASAMAIFADVYDRKAMSPLANRAEIAQANRDAKWRVENLVSETLTGKKLHNEGMRVSKAGDSANTTLSYSANQMARDLADFYGAYKNLNADEFAAQYWRYGASDYVPDDIAELRGRYNVILQNLYDKYVQETDGAKPVKTKAAPMTKEQFAANVVAKDDAMFKRVFEARTTKNKSPIEDYDEAGRTLLAKKIASEENAELDSMYKLYIGKEASTKTRAPKKMTMEQFENKLLKNMSSFERYYSDLYETSVRFAEMGGNNILAPSAAQGKTSIFTPEQLSFAAAKKTRHWMPEDFFADVKIDGQDARATIELDFGTAQELSETAVGLRAMRDTGDEIDLHNLDKEEHQQFIEKVIKPYLEESNSGLGVIHEGDNAQVKKTKGLPVLDENGRIQHGENGEVVRITQAEIQTRLRKIEKQKKVVAKKMQTAREFGDLSENAEYSSAIDEMKALQNEEDDLKGLMSTSRAESYDVLQDLGYGYKLVGVPREDEPLRETNFVRGTGIEENPKDVASRALAQYTEYTKKYNPAKEISKAEKTYKKASDEMASTKKQGEKVSKRVKKGTMTIDDLAKKTLSEEEYARFKSDADQYKMLKERKPVENETNFYEAADGKYKIVSGKNVPAGHTTVKALLDMLGYDSEKFNHDITEGRVYTDEEIAKDFKERKAMMKDVNKNLRKGNVRFRNVEEYKNPNALDIKSRTATINNLLAFCSQVNKATATKPGEVMPSDRIVIDKNYADLLFRISREGIGPSNFKGKVKTLAFELTDWNKFVQDFQLAGGASYVNAMTIAQMRGAIFSNPMAMASYIKLVTDFKDDAAVANFVVNNGARLSEIAMKVGDSSILTDFQAAASDKPGTEDTGTFAALTHRVIENYNNSKAATRDTGEKYDFAKDAVQNGVNAMFADATFNRMLPVLRAKMLINNYDMAVRELKAHFKQFDSDHLSASDAELLSDSAAKYAYAKTTAFFEPNKTAGGLWKNKSIQETLDNIYDDNMRRFLSSWTGAKDEVSIGQMASNCFFALGYKQRMIQPLLQGAKSMFGPGNILDRLSMAKAVDEATPELLERLGTQFMQSGNRQQLRTLAFIAIGAFITAKSLGLSTPWDDLSFTDEADGEFKVPDILKKFQTIGQIWIPNAVDENGRPYVDPNETAYNIDTMSSIFTLPNVGWKTVDRIFNSNSYYTAPQRGFGLFGQMAGINAQPVNDFFNQPLFRGIGDELIGSNLLSPYKAMYEVLVDSSYYGNNIWEKRWLSDGSENPNYDPVRNMKASFFHILGLDNYRTLSPRKYNDYVKGYYTDDYVAQDQIGSIGGSGILQHEYLTALINIAEGDALEGVIEAGELPIKKQKLSSTARTDFNTRIKNIIADAMAEYANKTENETNADVKDAAYAEAVKKSADAVAAWSAKYNYVLGRNQSLVPYVTRSMMAILAGEYDDRLDYIQNTYWKASQIAQIEASGPDAFWLDDADVEAWIDAGKTTEEFAAEKNKRHEAYNKALDEEYRARKALHDAGIDNQYLAGMSLQNLKAEQRAVNKSAYIQAMGIVNGRIGEFDNFKEMKAYYESQIDAATTKKAKAKLANQYNTYLTDALAPVIEKYGAGIIGDGYYNNNYLSNHLADYVIIPADKYYVGKSPRSSYLRDLFGVGFRDYSNEPSDDEVIEGYTRATKEMKAGHSASAVAALDRTIEAIKKGQLHVTDSDYSKIIRMRALLSARSK